MPRADVCGPIVAARGAEDRDFIGRAPCKVVVDGAPFPMRERSTRRHQWRGHHSYPAT
jgi:hypothetical protein